MTRALDALFLAAWATGVASFTGFASIGAGLAALSLLRWAAA